MQEFDDMQDVAKRGINENWKKALMIGSFAAAAVLLLTGRRPAGFALAGIGLATVAAEHPEKFEQFWNSAPEYLEKGTRLVNGVGEFVERIAQQSEKFQAARERQGRPDYIS
ncbi:MAG: hypothetical protein JWO13_1852 [Acidobacteriales bacterium]|nr:hypothetical protein [Terriglobales bacterium]